MLNLLTNTAPLLTLTLPKFKSVYLSLVGCGGTGSHIASGLVSLALALQDKDIACTIQIVDPDQVERKNVGRQLFAIQDIGKPKAVVVANRLTAAYGKPIGASVRAIDDRDTFTQPEAMNVVIGAVDNPAARSIIARAMDAAHGKLWWLDCGNENHSGQVAIGNTADRKAMHGAAALGMVDQLPAPHLVYPDLVATPKKRPIGRKQSCAELTASGEQSLMVNRMVAAHALSMLHALLLGQLRYFAVAFDMGWGGSRSMVIDEPTLAEVGK